MSFSLTFTLKIYNEDRQLVGQIDSLGGNSQLTLTNNGNYRFDYILNGNKDFNLNSYIIKDADSNDILYEDSVNTQVAANTDYTISKNRTITTSQTGTVTVNEKMICDITVSESE